MRVGCWGGEGTCVGGGQGCMGVEEVHGIDSGGVGTGGPLSIPPPPPLPLILGKNHPE